MLGVREEKCTPGLWYQRKQTIAITFAISKHFASQFFMYFSQPCSHHGNAGIKAFVAAVLGG